MFVCTTGWSVVMKSGSLEDFSRSPSFLTKTGESKRETNRLSQTALSSILITDRQSLRALMSFAFLVWTGGGFNGVQHGSQLNEDRDWQAIKFAFSRTQAFTRKFVELILYTALLTGDKSFAKPQAVLFQYTTDFTLLTLLTFFWFYWLLLLLTFFNFILLTFSVLFYRLLLLLTFWGFLLTCWSQ